MKTFSTMPHANGPTNGATKRGTTQEVLNGSSGVKSTKEEAPKTDYTRWRLKDDRGCQTWHYMDSDEENNAWPQSTADKYFLGLNTVSLTAALQRIPQSYRDGILRNM